jgi:hypothetical protein
VLHFHWVRRIFAEFAAKEFVSVQPMNLPSGLVFYLDFKYGTARPGFNADQEPNPAGHPFASPGADDSLFGVTNADTASDGLYGAGRFGYSIKNVTTAATPLAVAIDSASVNFDTSVVSNLANYKKIQVPVPTDADLYAVRTFAFSTGSTVIVPEQAFSTIDSNYTASFILTTAASASLAGWNAVTLNYSKQPTDIARGDFEDADPFKGTAGSSTGIDDGTDIDSC